MSKCPLERTAHIMKELYSQVVRFMLRFTTTVVNLTTL